MAMRAGTETGSLVNHLYSRMTRGQPEPVVGMGVTMLSWTDRHAGTIQRVWTEGKRAFFEATQDDARVISGSTQDGSAEYSYTTRPDRYRTTFRLEPDGGWTSVYRGDTGRWKKGGTGVRLGAREEYRDPSF